MCEEESYPRSRGKSGWMYWADCMYACAHPDAVWEVIQTTFNVYAGADRRRRDDEYSDGLMEWAELEEKAIED
jgi:hypothetical protein